jgi:hypothetical protein
MGFLGLRRRADRVERAVYFIQENGGGVFDVCRHTCMHHNFHSFQIRNAKRICAKRKNQGCCVFFNDGELGENTISETQAREMARFVTRWFDKVEALVVHCDAGISRSAGIGAAIIKWADGDDSEVLNCRSFRPNMKCYRLMLDALMETKQREG